jgi:O-antigen/teichoic acid export membrane protein
VTATDSARPGTVAIPGRIAAGTTWVFLAEALIVPTGLLTVGYLTRRLGPSDYGVYSLAVAMITWLEWGCSAPFARAGVRLVGAAPDWRPVASLVVRTQLAIGSATALGLWLVAPWVATVLDEPRLSSVLRLFALDLPLFALAQGHLQILVALSRFRLRALLPLVRWLVRLALIVVGVEAGLAIHGVILGIVGTSLIEVLLARRFVQPALFGRSGVPVQTLFTYAVPLLFSTLCLRVFDRLDLILLKFFAKSDAVLGMYGAAQTLTLAAGLFAVAFSPVLMSTLTRAVRAGDSGYAREISRDGLRCVPLLLPLAGILAGSARDLVPLMFGEEYLPIVPVFQCMAFAGVASVGISVGSAILVAAGRPSWTLRIAAPLPVIALFAHAYVIPRYDAIGAAFVTVLCATAGACMAFAAVHRLWHVTLPTAATIQGAVLAVVGVAVAGAWSTPGALVIVKLAALGTAFLLLLMASGELEIEHVVSAVASDRTLRAEP